MYAEHTYRVPRPYLSQVEQALLGRLDRADGGQLAKLLRSELEG